MFNRISPRACFQISAALRPLALAGAVLLSASSLHAQEFRATVSGAVVDQTGAAIPNAAITITELNTGQVSKTVSDGAGQYTVPFLAPGDYRIEANAAGFSKLVRDKVTLDAGDHPTINLPLAIGELGSVVNVTDEAPLIDQSNASVGQTITAEQVADLPLNGRTPIILAQLSIGVIATGSQAQVRAFDNNAGNAISIGGTPNQTSEILLDGSPDTTWSGAQAYSPMQDAVRNVSVSVFDTDASFGHTIGGVVNQITKSGTNRIHGTLYEFSQVSALDANTYFNNRKGIRIPVTHYNQYGGTVGGPVFIPKVFDGRDKVFFFFGYEGLKDKQPLTTLNTVPTAAERTGDFSALLAQGASNQLYNPFTATQNSKGQIVRQPIAGNNLAAAGLKLSPVALAYLKFFPLPNTTGTSTGAQNYIANAPSIDNYNNEFGRLDWNMSTRSHIFLDVRHNYRDQTKNDYFPNASVGSGLTRENFGASVDEIFTISPTTVADVRANWTYFNEIHNAPSNSLSPASVGLPAGLASSSSFVQLPFIGFSGSCTTFASFQCLGDTGANKVPSTEYQLFADVVKTIGRHTLKVGTDLRQYRVDVINYGDSSGAFTFGSNFVTAGTGAAAPSFGGDLASFLLGLPSTGDYVQAARASYHQWYAAGFVQDDWRASDHLTLNLGVRFDHDTPYEEKLGRTVSGFDPNAALPITAAANAAYAGKPSSLLPASGFNAVGGLTYPGSSNGAPYKTSSHLISPRIGFTYSPTQLRNTTLRGGFGMFVGTDNVSLLSSTGTYSSNPVTNQYGFSSTTSFISTNNNGLTPASTLDNPFPNGFTPVSGSSLGAGTALGQTISFLAPVQKDPYSLRWNLGIQHSFKNNLLAEVAYIANHSVNLPIGATQFNPIPARYLSTLPTRDQALITAYGTSVANPFAGLLPGSSLNGTTVSAAQLLSLHPQFPTSGQGFATGIIEQNNTIGHAYFESAQARVEKRMSKGLTLIANYSFSKLIEATNYLNDTDVYLNRRLSPYDHTHHFVVATTYDIPFGKGRMFGTDSKLLDLMFGGFRVNGIYTYQTGAPVLFTNDIPLAPGASLSSIAINNRNTKPVPSSTDPGGAGALSQTPFVLGSANQFQYHVRTLPQTFAGVRQDGINNLDASVLKDFHLTESLLFQLRFETFNTINHPTFGAPNVTSAGTTSTVNGQTVSPFGYITTQANTPRQVQIGGRIVF